MNLRPKLALTIIAISIPLVVAVEFMRANWYERNRLERRERIVADLTNYLTTRFEDGGEIERVNLAAARFGGFGSAITPREGKRFSRILVAPQLWAYDIGFVSDNTRAPEIPEDLQRALRESKSVAHIWRDPSEVISERDFDRRAIRNWRPWGGPPPRRGSVSPGPKPKLELGIMTSDDSGPAAALYVSTWVNEPTRDTTWWWLSYVLTGAFVIVALLAAGPIVHRIRQLTEEVGSAKAEGYKLAVQASGNDEIGRLARAFNAAGDDIRSQMERVAASETSLRRFVANTTHDVMIPLTVLQGHLTSLGAKLGYTETEARSLVARASNEAQYLGSILQNLSAVSKLEGADYVLRDDIVELGELVERVAQRHRTIARARSISIEHAIPPTQTFTRGDVTLLEQAVSNVTHNAVRYNEAGGNVAIILDVSHVDDSFRLRVVDDGPGIPDEELKRLPERRFRGDEARTRNPDGLGLGLHIARDVAAQHGFAFELRHSEFGGLEVEFAGKLAQDPSDSTTE